MLANLPTDSYIATALRNAGVPSLWADDALQDVRIALWRQAERDPKMVIRSAVVDAARRYGPHSRHGTDRTTTSLDAMLEANPRADFAAPAKRSPDYERIAREARSLFVLSLTERELIRRYLAPHTRLSDADHNMMRGVRHQLAAALNGELAIPTVLFRHRRRCQCGVIFWSDDGRQRACSPSCREMYRQRRRRKRTPSRRYCGQCKERLRYQLSSKVALKVYCGRACAQRARRARRRCA